MPGPAGPAADGAARNRQGFRSPGAVVTWYVWLLFAAANLVDLGVRGHDHTAAVYAAVLALITGVVYIAALRPRVIADDDAVTLRNPLRDTRIPWGAVTRIDLRELVCFHVQIQPTERAGAPPRHRVVRSWALQSSRRGRARARGQARRRDAAGRPDRRLVPRLAGGARRSCGACRPGGRHPLTAAAAAQRWRGTAARASARGAVAVGQRHGGESIRDRGDIGEQPGEQSPDPCGRGPPGGEHVTMVQRLA